MYEALNIKYTQRRWSCSLQKKTNKATISHLPGDVAKERNTKAVLEEGKI